MERFKLGKKWFWIGIIFSILFPLIGIIYGVCLLIEKNYRKEGLIIITCAILFAALLYFGVKFLQTSGFFGEKQCVQDALNVCAFKAKILKLQGKGAFPGAYQQTVPFITGPTSTPPTSSSSTAE